MKKLFLFITILTVSTTIFARKDTIRNKGFVFVPDSISINVGDTVVWVLDSIHNVIEVDSSTWEANGNTSNNGFSLGFRGGAEIFNTAGKYYYVCNPHAAIAMKGIVNVLSSVTNVSEEKLEKKFSFYPNPANQKLTIEFPQSEKFEIFEVVNELGQVVYLKQITSAKEQIDISQFTSGIYFLNLKKDEAILTRKLIVE